MSFLKNIVENNRYAVSKLKKIADQVDAYADEFAEL